MVHLAQGMCLKVGRNRKNGEKDPRVEAMMADDLRALAMCTKANLHHVVRLVTSVPDYFGMTAIALEFNEGWVACLSCPCVFCPSIYVRTYICRPDKKYHMLVLRAS